MYETTISTVQNSPEAAARVSEPQFEQERARHFAQSPPGGAKAADAGLRRLMPEKLQRLKFGRMARIKQGRDFARLRQEGERLVAGCLIANWRRSTGDARARLGVITSSK